MRRVGPPEKLWYRVAAVWMAIIGSFDDT